MSTRPERKKPREGRAGKAKMKLDDLPDLITHRLVADKLGVAPEMLREWVYKGVFPRPHSVFERTFLYRVDLIRAFLETGEWPRGTKFNRAGWRGSLEGDE